MLEMKRNLNAYVSTLTEDSVAAGRPGNCRDVRANCGLVLTRRDWYQIGNTKRAAALHKVNRQVDVLTECISGNSAGDHVSRSIKRGADLIGSAGAPQRYQPEFLIIAAHIFPLLSLSTVRSRCRTTIDVQGLSAVFGYDPVIAILDRDKPPKLIAGAVIVPLFDDEIGRAHV